MNSLTVRENHPAGLAAGLATPLAIVLVFIANALGLEMSAEVGAAIAALIVGAITAIVSARTPRVTIPDLPAVEHRGINSDTSGEFTNFGPSDTGSTGTDE